MPPSAATSRPTGEPRKKMMSVLLTAVRPLAAISFANSQPVAGTTSGATSSLTAIV